ncbi:putative membrane protein [Helicobacter pylori NQ4076]|uniref:Putative membrane protein n=1 Tax=Helicobacter pylori NQ4076 TaxID=992029 RepID=J0J9E8_HELPX|nr:putative membrane protein [Helicobacter pylori NQ4076]
MCFDWRFLFGVVSVPFKGFIIAKNIIFLSLAFALYLWGK